jgi:hypothetical protein
VNDAGMVGARGAARAKPDDLRLRRVRALRKDTHEAAIDLEAVPGGGAEIRVHTGWRVGRTRLFRSHEQAELVGAIAGTRAIAVARPAPRGSSSAVYRSRRCAISSATPRS